MKKFILIIILFFSCSFSVSAQEYSNDDFYVSSGASELYSGDILEDNGVSFNDPESILSLTPSKAWDIIKETVTDMLYAPIKLFLTVTVVIILTSLAEGMGDTVRSREMSGILEIICILAAVGIIFVPVCECIDVVSQALSEGAEFMLGFVPVFSGFAAAGGHVTSATGYSAAVFGFSNLAISAAENFFLPMLSMCFSTAIVDSCCDAVNLSGIINGVKKIVTWGLGLVMTIFTGILSVQSIVGASADSVAVKAAKYVLSNSIPLVGSAASDAYSTVRGSILLLKNGVGGIGIAALAVMLLPSLVQTLVCKITFFILETVSEIFGTKKLTGLFKNINSILSAAFGILICFMLMFIVSTGVVMSICTDIS
ncbi:MAG: stage III sporulation protein AE [Oscillospiraceae bacterium]|nr:stage III sporulation protein AE [Oscillospiraceae bacterium]